MKREYLISFLLALCANLFILTHSCLAVEDADVTYPTLDKSKYPRVGKMEGGLLAPFKKKFDKLKMDFSISLLGGYTTNLYEDHYDATSSFFFQRTLGADVKYTISDLCTLKASGGLSSIKYFRESEPNLLNGMLKAGFESKIADSLLFSAEYFIDSVGYSCDEAERHAINGFEAGLKHDLTDWLYHKVNYIFSYKHYPKWKTRNRVGTILPDDDRDDARNTIRHQIGFYLTDRTLINADNEISFNNSNYPFLDYYDYTAFKTKGAVTHLITDKLYGTVNLGYRYKTYENRNVSDGDDNQRDHLWMGGISLFYDLMPGLSIGTNFDYRRNFSNEGDQKYKDFIISSGVYRKF
jgi:hypothetical protein